MVHGRMTVSAVHVPDQGVPRMIADDLALGQREWGLGEGLYIGGCRSPAGGMRLTVRGDKHNWPVRLAKKIRDPRAIAALE